MCVQFESILRHCLMPNLQQHRPAHVALPCSGLQFMMPQLLLL